MKITQRQYNGYKKAHREWISDNDAYNKQAFGITKAQYHAIHKAIIDLTGIESGNPSLIILNKRLDR